MTTIISLAARDFITCGCDSLATSSVDALSPNIIASEFFDHEGKIKIGTDGLPLLRDCSQLWELSRPLPVNQLPSVTKLFDLTPAKASLLFAGASRIGELTVKNIVEKFKAEKLQNQDNTTLDMKELSNLLSDFISKIYETEIAEEFKRPLMEVILSGYSTKHWEPEIWKLQFGFNWSTKKFDHTITPQITRKNYGTVFGGQYDVIERVVNGIDFGSYMGLKDRNRETLEDCYREISALLAAQGYHSDIPKPNFDDKKYDLFAKNFGNVNRLFSDVGSLSEQAGIDFVYFLIRVMVNAQEFSDSIPTVGGNVHMALITKQDGFRWISQESFTYEGKTVLKYHNQR